MCNLVCFHGTCVTKAINTSYVDVCECDFMYSSKQCALRSGLLYIELPFALLILVVMAVAGVRITATALESLRFPESPKDDFAFPRSFQQTQRSLGVLTPYIGTWKGPMQRNLPWHKQHILTKLLLVVIVPLELLPYIQIAAINFLPIFPWPSTSFLTQAFRYSLLYPFWRHSTAELYPVYWFSGAAGFVFGALILVVLLGWQNFPLFKPQPAKSPVENPCTLVLRLYSDWAVIPVMISQLLPFECFLTGYNKAETFLFVLPVVRDQCFTWITLGHMSLGLAAMISYSFISSAIALQLNSESTEPIPVLWTDPVYVRVVQTVRMTLAMSVIAFGNANASMLAACSFTASAVLAITLLWRKPSMSALVNNLRLYGAVLGLWTSSTGFAVAVRDNSSDKSVAGVWSLGVISISALAFSAMFLYHTEEFWTKLGILGPPVDPKKLAKLTSGNEATEEEEEPPGLMMMPLKKPTVEVAQPPPVAATRLNLPRIQLRLGRVGKKKE